MASTVSLTLTEDDTPLRTWQITQAGSPLNLGAATIIMVIKASQHVEDDAVTGVYTLTVGSGLTLVDASLGKVEAEIPPAVTASPGTWFYKIRVTVTGNTETAIDGWISITDA